ncbi:25864_t:CDS:2 [Dentiscutata erythropus]|uniref:25864_t:CDS:1 n=1 Tax=Dentiscutata erythropus TaxID=1348616 RepID=A0A9N9H274_9GLOM|nr:25864_t:CDS:2 [Dentiscutata erythropus]
MESVSSSRLYMDYASVLSCISISVPVLRFLAFSFYLCEKSG